MKAKRNFLVADIAYLGMLLLLFVCILFISENPDNLQKNSIILAAVLIMVIITYFTSLTAGLVLNIVMIFGYSVYVIVSAAYRGITVDSNIYFWIFWTPCITVTAYLFARRTLSAEKENEKAQEQLQRLSGVDALTELKNMRGFEQECNVYMKISRRYNMELVLLVWQFRYQRELSQMIGEEGLQKLVVQVSQIIAACLREEDAVFMLDNDPYLWGTLLFTNAEATHIIIERVQKELEHIELKSGSGKHLLALDMRVGTARCSELVQSPFHFLEQAKKRAQYDV